MFINFEHQTRVMGVDGKSMILDIEATVRKDTIERMTAWYDEQAMFVNLQNLSEAEQALIKEKIWAEVERQEAEIEKRSKDRSDKIFDEYASESYVRWINGGSR